MKSSVQHKYCAYAVLGISKHHYPKPESVLSYCFY
jgi:hypothetical protein